MAASVHFGWMVFLSCSVTSVAVEEMNGADGNVSSDAMWAAEAVPIPPGALAERHYYHPGTGEHRLVAAGLPPLDLVYVNEPPPVAYIPVPVANLLIADDITTIAVSGCNVNYYEIKVAGGGDGGGSGFTTNFAIYDGCPSGGGQMVPGTEGSFTSTHDGIVGIIVDLDANPVYVNATFWIGVSFDRAGPGWLVGTPAEVGFTDDIYDIPYTSCTASFAGTGLYAGFDARVACEQPFDVEFAAYVNNDLTGMTYPGAAERWIMDDIQLIVDDCLLGRYEIAATATGGGGITVTAELRTQCEPAFAVEGTRATEQFGAYGGRSFVEFVPSAPVNLGPGNQYWVAFKFDRAADVIFSGRATVGFTEDSFAVQSDDGQGCDLFMFGGDPHAGLAINVYCRGQVPVGACCDRSVPGSITCSETIPYQCLGPLKLWVQGTVCEPDGAPCDVGGCCTPPNSPYGETCVELPQQDCEAMVDEQGNPSEWQELQYCGSPGQDCIRWVCRHAEGVCDVSNGTPGCNIPSCCDRICDQDSFCCTFEWDSTCAERALSPSGCINLPASTDDCYDPDPYTGAFMLNECSVSREQCASDADCPAGQRCQADGGVELRNTGATSGAEEGFCCHPDGPGTPAFGGVWAKFTATGVCAQVSSCSTQDDNASDALIQVFRASDHSSEEAACNSLIPIGCNDDFDCSNAGQAKVFLYDLTVGETYYVLLASKSADSAGHYLVSLYSYDNQPCLSGGNLPGCPAGSIDWLDPPDGVVDARQPHDMYDVNRLRGIDAVTVLGPVGTHRDCWTLCDDGGNGIASVEPHRDCTSTLHFDRAITAAVVTRVVYTGDGTPASFTAHPGNVDANGATDPSDIIALIDVLNEVNPAPWGLYSCDMDDSGVCDPSDIIGVIDLLNGAGEFEPWFGTELPTATGGCP